MIFRYYPVTVIIYHEFSLVLFFGFFEGVGAEGARAHFAHGKPIVKFLNHHLLCLYRSYTKTKIGSRIKP